MKKKKTVLFICSHNAARSQIAEGYLRARYNEQYKAFSAGIHPSRLSTTAVMLMKEVGVDISGQRSKSISGFLKKHMDYVVTVCDTAEETCPVFPLAGKTIHVGFPNPASLSGPDEVVLGEFRRIRDDIMSFIDKEFGPVPG
jgi:arsenate reductase